MMPCAYTQRKGLWTLLVKFWSQGLLLLGMLFHLQSKVCKILEDSALMAKGVYTECEPWIVASRLRDHLLSPKERKDPVIWKKVEELVLEDSRVDQYPQLLKGESIVWEWQVEGSLSTSRMRKKEEASKSRSTEGRAMKFGQQHHALKAGETSYIMSHIIQYFCLNVLFPVCILLLFVVRLLYYLTDAYNHDVDVEPKALFL